MYINSVIQLTVLLIFNG